MSKLLPFILLIVLVLLISPVVRTQPIIINHLCTDLSQIPSQWIERAKSDLVIAYGHTSHGSQLTDGMSGLASWKGTLYAWNHGGAGGALDLHDYAMGGDCGYYPDWVNNTRAYLDDADNSDVNVIIWSWCGQASSKTEQTMLSEYLAPMAQLEADYPNVKFVYMTGHLDGSGSNGNLNLRNQQIRNFCRTNNRILYDFADIESYDPDRLINYMELMANDNCDYDSDGNHSLDRNWAIDWQNAHTLNADWYDCSAAHSQALNGNRKAYAAWWLWASLAGWGGHTAGQVPREITVYQNYPNPFNPSTTIRFSLLNSGKVTLKIYDVLGREIATLLDEFKNAGEDYVEFSSDGLSSGIYFYRIATANTAQIKKLVIMK